MSFDVDGFAGALEKTGREMGAKVFGVADMTALKKMAPDLLSSISADSGGCSRAVVFGMRLQRAVLESLADRPSPLYFHNYRQVNYELDRIALMAADSIQDAGFRALAIPASQIIVKSPMAGHISHKVLGWAAGIGFIGRSTLLVHPEYGAQVRYVSVLTDMPLPAGIPHQGDCGDCRACVAACPANAIADEKEHFNLEACYRKLTEFSRLPFIGQHICGLCVKPCRGRAGCSGLNPNPAMPVAEP